jgi:hypothetical protein
VNFESNRSLAGPVRATTRITFGGTPRLDCLPAFR